MHDKLILVKPIFLDKRFIGLIAVPTGLRRLICSHYHCGPSGGHMGEYKTLFRIRMRFYWPGIRNDVKLWVKNCTHCTAYDVWRNRKISILVQETTTEMLGKLFLENVVFTFGMVSVVVVDAESKFLGMFEEMCKAFGFKFWALSRGNHKGNRVEKYHRFLNKTQTIVGQERGTHLSFIENCKTSQYAWNSAPIDDTDIPRSLAAVGRHFKFPMDIDLNVAPTINCHNQSALYTYLRDVSNDSQFATSILQVLIEERRTAHRLRWNTDRAAKLFKVGDVVKAHVQVNSKAATGDDKKLSYQARGPFQIESVLAGNSYVVKRYNSTSSATRKYKGSELYLLPPSVFPNNPVDTMDQRYLNYSFAPVPSPLQKSLQIDLYNDTYFPCNSKHISNSTVDQASCHVDEIALKEHLDSIYIYLRLKAYLKIPSSLYQIVNSILAVL